MSRDLFLLLCLMASMFTVTLQHNLENNETDQSWRKTILEELRELKSSLAGGKCLCEGGRKESGAVSEVGTAGFGAVIAQLVAGQKQMQHAIDTSSSTMKADLQRQQMDLQRQQMELQAAKNSGLRSRNQGSTFIRWGRKECPSNASQVYSGVAGGKLYSEKGSGANSLCLPMNPQFDDTPLPPYYGTLYGAEYEMTKDHQDQDVPCSVCRAPQATTILMPATTTCPPGWTVQYSGHLASERNSYSAGEYVCLDRDLEYSVGGANRNNNGLLLYLVITKCGSLPCPPYVKDKVVTCAICSK